MTFTKLPARFFCGFLLVSSLLLVFAPLDVNARLEGPESKERAKDDNPTVAEIDHLRHLQMATPMDDGFATPGAARASVNGGHRDDGERGKKGGERCGKKGGGKGKKGGSDDGDSHEVDMPSSGPFDFRDLILNFVRRNVWFTNLSFFV